MMFGLLIFMLATNIEASTLGLTTNSCGVAAINKDFSRLDMLMPEHRLVGGIESTPHAWPWTGQLLLNNKHHCGCALIDSEIALTAAHCFAKSRKPSLYNILLGGHEIFSGTRFFVSAVSIHPLYQTSASAYDVALIRIFPPAKLNANISTICLPSTPPPFNRMCVVTGWGKTSEGGERARALREIHIPIIPPFICNNLRHYAGRIQSSSMICAGYNNGRIDSCQGDSGGPLQCQNVHGAWELQGVVSWGIGCAQPDFPGVYSKIFVMVGWINSQKGTLKQSQHNFGSNSPKLIQ